MLNKASLSLKLINLSEYFLPKISNLALTAILFSVLDFLEQNCYGTYICILTLSQISDLV